jgi:hypothetical protein
MMMKRAIRDSEKDGGVKEVDCEAVAAAGDDDDDRR